MTTFVSCDEDFMAGTICSLAKGHEGPHGTICNACGWDWYDGGHAPDCRYAVEDDDALDVWLRFESPGGEEASHEANTYRDGDNFRVEWYHTAVGQVSTRTFATREEAAAWLTAEDFQDFSS